MAWLSTHLQAAVAASQCHRLCGVSTVASPGGTLAWSRNSAATVRVDVPNASARCCTVAPNMPRTALIGTAKGMVCEPEVTNKVVNTLLFEISASGCTLSTGPIGPDGRTNMVTATQTSVGVGSYAYTNCSAFPSGTAQLAVGFHFLRGSTSGVVRAWNSAALGIVDIDMAQMPDYPVYLNRGVSRAGVTWSQNWIPRESDRIAYFLMYWLSGGSGTAVWSVWGIHVEQPGHQYASSTISAGASTRLADSAVYTLSTEIDTKQGMAKVSYDKGPTSGGAIAALDISDGGSSADHVAIGIDASDHATAASAMTGGDAGATAGTTDVRDGAAHTIQATWQDDALTVYADGTAEGTPDTACDMPENLDTITIGPARQLITSIKVWTTNLAKAM